MSRLTKLISTVSRPIADLIRREHKAARVTRRMRLITGVREQILDQIPSERTRYTALAAVMMCTATFGGFSMFFALGEIMGSAEFWFVPLAMFWSLFVLCVDCWLVSSSTGTRFRARASVLLPRLLVAMFIGAFIAEPVVLRVFQTAIVSQVRDDRQHAIDKLTTNLISCNPVPGTSEHVPPEVSCQNMSMGVNSPAAGDELSLSALNTRAATLDAEIEQENGEINRKEALVNAECNGAKGHGLTGIAGNGPACKQDQQYLKAYVVSHPVEAQGEQLAALEQQVTSLQGTVSTDKTSYQDALTKKIAARLAEETAPGSTIGLGERFDALGKISLSSGFIGVASWFVRIFFVLIDCLPVLVMFISGTTPYDRLAESEIASAERIFMRRAGARESAAEEEIALQVHEAKVKAASRRREIDLDLQRHDADAEARKEDAVDQLFRRKLAARRFKGGAGGQPYADSSPHNGARYPRADDLAG